jgi:hypothetical protein
MCRPIGGSARAVLASPSLKRRPGKEVSLSRALWVEGALRPLWLYHQTPGDRARRSVLSGASTARRQSWQASRASAADLPSGDKRLFSEAPALPPARPSVMSQQLRSRTRQARGPTAAAQPQPTMWFFRPSTSTLNMHSETVILFRQHCGPIVTFSRPADRRRRRARHRGAAGARKRGDAPLFNSDVGHRTDIAVSPG